MVTEDIVAITSDAAVYTEDMGSTTKYVSQYQNTWHTASEQYLRSNARDTTARQCTDDQHSFFKVHGLHIPVLARSKLYKGLDERTDKAKIFATTNHELNNEQERRLHLQQRNTNSRMDKKDFHTEN